MNKTELIDQIALEAGISKADSGRALDAFVVTVTNVLAKKDDVALVGFGTFSTSERSARTGRNPQTGETINILATVVAKFKPGKVLKDAVKQ